VSQDVPAGIELAGLRGLEVLLVDDVSLNQEVVCDMLEGAGIVVRLASNGREAIDAIHQNLPDCVLMDCHMPIMDGYEATRKIRADERFHKLPIIALTANAMHTERARCQEAGMNGFLTKPVKSHELFAALVAHCPPRHVGQVAMPGAGNIQQQTATALPALHGIDSQLGLHYANAKPALYRKLLRLFRDSHGHDFEPDFRGALESGDWKAANRLTHTLKSSARMIGASHLGQLAEALDEVCHARQSEAIAPLLSDLIQELNKVCTGLAVVGSD
jgi:CheY-like chemotaxis protein